MVAASCANDAERTISRSLARLYFHVYGGISELCRDELIGAALPPNSNS
jgi:hypothetical protein